MTAIRQRAERYDARYGLTDPLAKAVDNQGNGDERLYGTRNVRVVLRGVLYRGGANNTFNRDGARPNSNPLTTEGLENLCEEGFGESLYLYPKNFSAAPKSVTCTTRLDGSSQTTSYQQLSALDDRQLKEILRQVRETILDASKGPIYAHCWNGWHASGLVSATALMQFCGISRAAALDYWTRATDGNQSGYENVRARIADFQPDPRLSIPADVQAVVCPSVHSTAGRNRA